MIEESIWETFSKAIQNSATVFLSATTSQVNFERTDQDHLIFLLMAYCVKELAYSLILCLGSLTFGVVMGFPSAAIPKMKKDWGEVELLNASEF
jgi:hypothetical protein